MKTLPYSTIGGQATRGETLNQLMDYLRQAQDVAKALTTSCNPELYIKLTHSLDMAQEASAVIGHLYNTEDTDHDKLMAKGWLGISELIKLNRWKVTNLATRKPTSNQWNNVAKLFEGMIWHINKFYEGKRQ